MSTDPPSAADVQGHQVIDHPGAVVVTQTEPETYLRTAELRDARLGDAVPREAP